MPFHMFLSPSDEWTNMFLKPYKGFLLEFWGTSPFSKNKLIKFSTCRMLINLACSTVLVCVPFWLRKKLPCFCCTPSQQQPEEEKEEGEEKQPAQKQRRGEVPCYQQCLSVQKQNYRKRTFWLILRLPRCHHFWLVVRGPRRGEGWQDAPGEGQAFHCWSCLWVQLLSRKPKTFCLTGFPSDSLAHDTQQPLPNWPLILFANRSHADTH